MMNYWLIKSEPNAYSWDDLVRDERTHWDGVRNYAARNYLKDMEVGDLCLFYHSVHEKECVGIAKVERAFYQDPTTDDVRWVVVDFVPERKLKKPVTLEMIKSEPALREMKLVKIPRLSVQPVKKEEFDMVIAMSEA